MYCDVDTTHEKWPVLVYVRLISSARLLTKSPTWLCHGSALAAAITEYRKDWRRQELVALRSTLEISRLKNDV